MSTKIPLIVPKRSMFNLSQGNVTTFGFGELIPTYYRDLLPGDHFKIKQSFSSRFLALVAPIMHKVRLCNSWFFVPYRLVWKNWEDFISPKDFLSTENTPAVPYGEVPSGDNRNFLNSLLDYFDLLTHYDSSTATTSAAPSKFNLFYIAAYRKLWNDFYRDQNLQEELPFELSDGDLTEWWDQDAINAIKPLARAYHSDYFTSALPWTQKGNPVFIPFGVEVDLKTNDLKFKAKTWSGSDVPNVQVGAGGGLTGGNMRIAFIGQGGNTVVNELWSILGLEATATNGTATINDLRTALALQRWLERNARGGTRYVEYIFAHFGVVSPDARLQRAEFIGGNETPIAISEVLQTSQTSDSSPLGVPAGSAFSAGVNRSIYYHAKEHGMLICVTSLMFDNVYMSGQDRHNRKFDRFEFFTPSFANIGEQEIYKSELGSTTDFNAIFGYSPRYEEYRVAHNRVHGDMRDTLAYWHLARSFNNPNLNQAFIQSNNRSVTDRIFPYDQNTFPQFKQFLAQMWFDVKALRPVPKHGLPSIL